jgi:hypothetical protein
MESLPVRVILAVAVLAPGIGQSPAFRHRHAGGDRPHHHAEGLAVCHLHRHAEVGDDEHDDAGGGVLHVHVSFFGLELILPQESSDEELPRRDHVPALVPLNMDVVAATFASDPDCRPAPVASTDSPLEPAPVGAFSLSHPRVARSAPLLCDTARHERSGVQLA